LFVSPIFNYEIKFSPLELIKKTDKVIETYNILTLPEFPVAHNAVFNLVEIYLDNHVLTNKHYFDLSHIAFASIFSCDFLISCDFAHIVRQRTIRLIQKINTEQNIFVPNIVTHQTFLEIKK
jgi:hypothetical protein